MPDRMLCAVLEQFQLYFSLWYVRFVSIQSVIFSCVLRLKWPVKFSFFCIHTFAQRYKQMLTCTGNTWSHPRTMYSIFYWHFGVWYREDHAWSFQMVSYWSCSNVIHLFCVPCVLRCVSRWPFNNATHSVLITKNLLWQFKSGKFTLRTRHCRKFWCYM